jgi:hypothetical protein
LLNVSGLFDVANQEFPARPGFAAGPQNSSTTVSTTNDRSSEALDIVQRLAPV